MIQRIQSIYLLVIVIISLVLVLSDIPFYQETGKPVTFSEETGDQTILEKTSITVDYNSTDTPEGQVAANNATISVLAIVAGLALITIFLFKNRKLQLKLTFGVIVATIVLFGSMYLLTFGNNYTEIDSNREVLLGSFIPVAIILFAILAYQRISKDEKLVRSLDRIR